MLSSTQISDSDANKHAAAHVHPSTAAADSEANKHATPTDISTHEADQNSLPPPDSTTSTTQTDQIPTHEHDPPGSGTSSTPLPMVAHNIPATDLDENKQSTLNDHPNSLPTDQVPPTESLTNKVATSNQDFTAIDKTNPPAANSDTNTTPATNEPNKSSTKPKSTQSGNTADQERKQLLTLIDQELKYVDKICPKLGEHQKIIKEEADKAKKLFDKLKKESCELKGLKDLKKIVTKLKLQIPDKYRTYDESDQEESRKTDLVKKGVSWQMFKQMPQLHDELFHKSPFCKAIQKRYNDLRRQLKLCLLCFSVFPENAKISRRLMVYWWIGEGLIIPSEKELGIGRTAEDYANGLFKELMDNDFIEPVSKGQGRNVAFCKMHPMVRAALVMIADEVKFFDFDEYGNPKDLGKFDEIEKPEDMPDSYQFGDTREFFDFLDGKGNKITDPIDFDSENPISFAPFLEDENRSDRDESITGKKYYYKKKKIIATRSYKVCLMGSGLSKGITWEKLHVLFNVKDDILEFKPEWFLRMKNVNVLFLGRWQSSAAHHIEVEDFDFSESLNHTSHMRFFSLQGISRISELPKSISKLESLLILDLRACHNLEKIPKTIGSLKCLTHLDMSDCYLLQDMPKEISSLEALQVLKGFVVDDSPGKQTCTLQDLKKLKDLRKLSMYTHMKGFPQESHLDALKEFDMLRKLTILWSVHESKDKSEQSGQHTDEKCKQDAESKRKKHHAWGLGKFNPRKEWVKGSMRRMNAFNTSTLGSRLEKLDLKCFPDTVTPNWLTPGSLKGLKKLYIRGGQFSDIGQYQDILEWDPSSILPKETWNVEVLRLKYLEKLKMDWKELQNLFPKMNSLEKVKCPWLALFPCNEHGIWTKKEDMINDHLIDTPSE